MTRYGTPASRAFALTMLLVVYTFNFLDRQVLGILAVPIKTELGLTDLQLGMLGGLAFAILYSTLALPFAWIADRTKRTFRYALRAMTAGRFELPAIEASCMYDAAYASLHGAGLGAAGPVAPVGA